MLKSQNALISQIFMENPNHDSGPVSAREPTKTRSETIPPINKNTFLFIFWVFMFLIALAIFFYLLQHELKTRGSKGFNLLKLEQELFFQLVQYNPNYNLLFLVISGEQVQYYLLPLHSCNIDQ